MPVYPEKLQDAFGCAPVIYDIEDIKNNPSWFQDVLPKGAIFICDECYKLWPQGMKTTAIPAGHQSFIAEHRHYVSEDGCSTEIVIASQDLSQLCTFVRNLVATTYRTVKLDAIGADGSYRVDIYIGSVSGPNPPKTKLSNQQHGKYKKTVWQFYKSHTHSLSGAGNEKRIDGRVSIRKKVITLITVGSIGAIFMITTAGTLFKKFFGDSEAAEAVEHAQTNAAPAVQYQRKIDDMLSGYSVEITFNNGIYPAIDYVVRAEKGDNYFTLTSRELLKLGYELKPINQCLLKIVKATSSYIATCRKPDDGDFIDFNFGKASATES